MIVSSASPESRIVAAKSRCSSLSGVSSSRPLMPMTAFIGVRISWLMVARNALLASLAASAAARASCVSLEQARVLDRDHRLVGEGLQQLDLLVGERPGRLAHHAIEPMPRPSRISGTRARCRSADPLLQRADVGGRSGDRRQTSAMCTGRRSRMARPVMMSARSGSCVAARWLGVVPRHAVERTQLVVVDERRSCRSVAAEQALAAVEDLRRTPAHVGRAELADHAQHLGGGGLLLERLLGLVEQAHVLDRDHRLVGEGLQQVDLGRRRTGRACARSSEITPIARALAQHRHGQHACGSRARLERRARRDSRCRCSGTTSSTWTSGPRGRHGRRPSWRGTRKLARRAPPAP